MEEKAFELIEKEIEKNRKKRNEYLEADKNEIANKYEEKLFIYEKILDLMVDGKMYKEFKQKKKDEKIRKDLKIQWGD